MKRYHTDAESQEDENGAWVKYEDVRDLKSILAELVLASVSAMHEEADE